MISENWLLKLKNSTKSNGVVTVNLRNFDFTSIRGHWGELSVGCKWFFLAFKVIWILADHCYTV